MYEVVLTQQSKKDLTRLSKDIQIRILKKLKYFSSNNNPLIFSKPLVNLPPSTHRFRVGNYRIAFYISGMKIIINRIKHRKEVYQ